MTRYNNDDILRGDAPIHARSPPEAPKQATTTAVPVPIIVVVRTRPCLTLLPRPDRHLCGLVEDFRDASSVLCAAFKIPRRSYPPRNGKTLNVPSEPQPMRVMRARAKLTSSYVTGFSFRVDSFCCVATSSRRSHFRAKRGGSASTITTRAA